jgi:hypothetical protein
MLCRGVKLEGAATDAALPTPTHVGLTRWKAPADIGRRYARVSGDYNPIHLSALTAKLFRLPQAIAHGLWNRAQPCRPGRTPAGPDRDRRRIQPVRLPSRDFIGQRCRFQR